MEMAAPNPEWTLSDLIMKKDLEDQESSNKKVWAGKTVFSHMAKLLKDLGSKANSKRTIKQNKC